MKPTDAMDALASEVIAGRCVAFVGAGFSAAVCRLWGDLLAAVATEVEDAGVRRHVEDLLAERSARAFEMAAQILEDAFKNSPTHDLLQALRKHTRRPEVSAADQARMDRRHALLTEIPFAAILTTNFDDELKGDVLDSGTYASLLRDSGSRWVERRFWNRRSQVLKLHGDLHRGTGITLSRRGYRTRLYSEPGYLHVLRSVLLTKTVLFLGFSFTDEYLNELRSEVLAYLAPQGKTPRYAYALLDDVPPAMLAHFRDHEAMHVFGYATPGDTEHRGFDDFLAKLHERTNPAAIMGRRLENKRMLWVDPSTDRNAKGRKYLEDATRGLCTIDLAETPDEAIAKLETGERYDLVITRWGHHPRRAADGRALLEQLRARDLRVPVVVFASGDHVDENREVALRLGALEYTFAWDTLFAVIDRRFA
jgi:CheY-like chemotaxis protein